MPLILRHKDLIELKDQCGAWNSKIETSALVQDHTQVLHEELHLEAWPKVASNHAWSTIFEPPALCSALREESDQLVVLQAGFLGVEKGLADAGHVERIHHLVGKLGVL